MIVTDNWNFTYFEHNNLKAMIGVGTDYDSDSNKIAYFANILDNENNELFSKCFQNIDAACRYLNNKYAQIWDFKSLEKPVSSSGCSTCVAH